MKNIDFIRTDRNSVFTDFKYYKTVKFPECVSDFYFATHVYKNEYEERVSVEVVNGKIRSWQS